MKCVNCAISPPEKAEWLVMDDVILQQLLPLCETCLHQLVHMEGEINIEYYPLPTSIDFSVILRKINQIWASNEGHIASLYKQNAVLEKQLKEGSPE